MFVSTARKVGSIIESKEMMEVSSRLVIPVTFHLSEEGPAQNIIPFRGGDSVIL
jgi:hypothetical protein